MFLFMGRRIQFILGGLLVLLLAACGGGGSGGGFSDNPDTPPSELESLSITGDLPSDAKVGDSYSGSLTAEGGGGNYQWSVLSGELPPGLELESGGNAATVSGTPTNTGNYSFVLQVKDPDNPDLAPATLSATIAVTTPSIEALSITGELPGNAQVGQNYAASLTAAGGSGNYRWSVLSGELPPGLELQSEDNVATVSGTPTADGNYSFVLQVNDPDNPDLTPATRSATIAVAPSVTATIKDVQLLVTSPQLPSGGNNFLTLTAIVRDVNNNTVEGVIVTFKADNNGTIQVTRPETNETGTAEARLSTQGHPENRQIKVTAEAGKKRDSVVVNVVGTVISIAAPESASKGENATITLSLVDSAGQPVADQTLHVSSRNSNFISNPTPVTDSNGRAQVQIRGISVGTDVITVSGAGAIAQQEITIVSGIFAFVSPTPNTEIQVNEPQRITVEWREAGNPVVGQQVRFTATRGVITATAVTDANGRATATIQSTTAGRSIIVATAPDGTSIQLEVVFVATQPHSFYLQVNPKIMGPFQQSTVKALVFDLDGNPVKGIRIFFNLEDNTGGSLSDPFAVTNEGGEANITYRSAGPISGYNQVKITATVENTTLSDTTTLTVAEKTVFIRFATGNEIEELDTTSYAAPYRVWLTDTAGNPIADAKVRLGVVPTAYRKGYYLGPGEGEDCWRQIVTAGWCNNEDINRNGRLDIPPDVDENNDGRLWPGNVASVVREVTTGADGSAAFTVNYGKNYAYWVDVELTGSTTVAGSESSETISFILQGIVPDFCNAQVNPPGNPSPFGVATSCADPN